MLLDTSALIELQAGGHDDEVVKRIRGVIDGHLLFASPIHLGEVADAARRIVLPVEATVQKVRDVVDLIPLDADIAVQGSHLKAEARQRKEGKDFSLIDGIGLATARSRGMPLVTM